MSDREDIIKQFLSSTKWAAWNRTAIAADASARRYERLTQNDSSVILMDAPPHIDQSTAAFIEIAEYLTDRGFQAPQILAQDRENGILLLSDLGSWDYARWLRKNPKDNGLLYKNAIDVLVKLENCEPSKQLTKMTPECGTEMVEITGDYYAKCNMTDVQAELLSALRLHAPEANTIAMRDFHAENLIWRPDQTGIARVGILDFQDAFIAPSGYDLASLLRDARRDIDPRFAEDMIAYFLKQTQRGDGFRVQLACLAIQRNLRILGVFVRLATEMQKKKYINLIPRVWGHIQQDLTHSALAKLRDAVNETLPAPSASFLESLRK